MTCGISGSGKSTLANNIISTYPNFTRLSIDAHVFSHHGTYSISYPPSLQSTYQTEAEISIISTLKNILKAGTRDVVLDMAFYNKETRDEYRQIIQEHGGGRYTVCLVVFKGTPDTIWRRIEARRIDMERKKERGDGWEGMSIDRETLNNYDEGFEWPDGEGEIVIDID
jgi:predicted kinase